ncbi:MAG: sialate O-acetylesterase [Verrucomicrobiota bacterium]
MNIVSTIGTSGIQRLLLILLFCFPFPTNHLSASSEDPLSENGVALQATFDAELRSLQNEIEPALPVLSKEDCDAFMDAYVQVGKVRGTAKYGDKEAYKATFVPVAEAQAEALRRSRPILSQLDQFLGSGELDAALAKHNIITSATPTGLARFAEESTEQELLVKKLLGDTDLMIRMLKAGGAKSGNYGQAIQIYTQILQESEHARKPGILQRFALGLSLELAVPTVKRAHTKIDPDQQSTIDPVQRYLHYEAAYLKEELDPAFETLSTWECRFVCDSDAPNEELAWGRRMLKTYRPDLAVSIEDRWRYSKIVGTEVQYGGKNPSIPELGFFQDIMNMGGVCGRRAFFGRFILKAFGNPSFGVKQPKHAALGRWTPNGWQTNLGADWHWSWWNRPGHERSGSDFLLETQAREHPADFIKVLRAEWVAQAVGEEERDRSKLGTGGLWSALALYKKRAIIADHGTRFDAIKAGKQALTWPTIDLNNNSVEESIVYAKNGTITIPAANCSFPLESTKLVRFMPSFGGGQQLHYSRTKSGNPEHFEYTVHVPSTAAYSLTSQVATVNTAQQLSLSVNDSRSTEIQLPHTIGLWETTSPVRVVLAKGKNTLRFERNLPNYGCSIKKFVLSPSSMPPTPAEEKSVLQSKKQSSLDDNEGPIKVFILAGQSNMQGHGHTELGANPERSIEWLQQNGGERHIQDGRGSLRFEVNTKPKRYAHLVEADGSWVVRDDVWIRYLSNNSSIQGPLTIGFGAKSHTIGPEFGFGFVVGDTFEQPVLLIKTAWGGKSLAKDFRPPSAVAQRGGEIGAYYELILKHIRDTLIDRDSLFPELVGREFEFAGFGWHQGWNDGGNIVSVDEYEANLADFIRDVRRELGNPELPFVIAGTGIGGANLKSGRRHKVLLSQLAMSDSTRYPDFADNVAAIDTRPFYRQGIPALGQGYHWHWNGETQYLMGESMGKAILELIAKGDSKGIEREKP